MEDLNKTQIVLLAIFITFVTAAATGVVTVTLMDQTPPGVTQTVNRIVERTVEKVISPGKVEKTEIKQIVREDDTIIASIKKSKQSLIKVVRGGALLVANSSPQTQQASLVESLKEASEDNTALVAQSGGGVGNVGFIVSSDGLILTSNDIVGQEDATYSVVLPDETKHSAKLLKESADRGIALFKMEVTEKNKTFVIPLNAISGEQVSLGQTVIALSSDYGLSTVSIGYVSGFKSGNASSSPVIKTSIKPTENWSGRPIIDINGYLVGMYGKSNDIVPYSVIKNLIDSVGVAVEKTKTTP